MNRKERRKAAKAAAAGQKVAPGIGSPLDAAAVALMQRAGAEYQAGHMAETLTLCQQVLAGAPDFPDALFLGGLSALQSGKAEVATGLLEHAVRVIPANVDAHVCLGNARQATGDIAGAAEAYGTAIDLRPEYAEAHSNMANVLQELGSFDDAIISYRRALEIKPDFAMGYFNLGVCLEHTGALGEAEAAYRTASLRDPGYAEPLNNLGNVLIALGHYQQAFDAFNRHFLLRRRDQRADASADTYRYVTRTKLQHDIDQFGYLAKSGNLPPALEGAAEAAELLLRDIKWDVAEEDTAVFSPDQHARVGRWYNRAVQVIDCPALSGAAINPALDVEAITADYFSGNVEVTWFDDLLTGEALASLRKFCLDSTIWYDISHREGFLGAYISDGFCSPLLMQIADELRKKFPAVFKDHQLRQMWGYKYDSSGAGITPHADFAAVNVNFWITPDEACIDPDNAGLLVFDAEPPLDWDFEDYNRDVPKIRAYISENTTEIIRVAHRQNRALMFHSDLFHETGGVAFKDDYASRRINITLLFGDRLEAHGS